MVDIRQPTQPTFAGCYLMDGGSATAANVVGLDSPSVGEFRVTGAYVHDTQCVVYDGPDTDHTDREICLSSAEDRVTIVDVTDKLSPTLIASVSYPEATYTHQGWLTEDHRYLLVNDELDEVDNDAVTNTRTIIFDLEDLDEPAEPMIHTHDYISIDHNLYTHDGLLYQSHYSAGLRVSDLSRVGEGVLEEVAFFDVHPDSDVEGSETFQQPVFAGTWSNYPYFESGTIAVSGYDGLWLLRLQDGVGGTEPLPDCPPAPVDLPGQACRFNGPHFQRPGPR
jgi:choice-of-anchor B domain-containing protein